MKWWSGLLLLALSLAALLFLLMGILRKLETDQLFVLEQTMLDTARAVSTQAKKLALECSQLEADLPRLQEALMTTQNATGSRIRVLDAHRSLVADSLGPELKEQSQLRFRPEIQSAFTGQYGAYTRASDETTRSLALFVAVPVRGSSGILGVIYVSHSTDDILQQLGIVRRWATRAMVALAGGALLLAFLVTGRLRGTLKQLGRLTSRVAEVESEDIPMEGDQQLDEIGQNFNRLVASLRSKVEQLESERKKTKFFLEDVAHELKTPITGLSGSVESLRYDKLDQAAKERLLGIVEKETARISELTSRLLELQKLDYDTLKVENFDLVSVAETVMDSYRTQAEKRDVALELCGSENVLAQGDSKKIQRVVENLVENAIRCSPQGGAVVIELTADSESASLSVSDEGPGPPSLELFRRNKQGEHSQGSLGLGLSIAQEILRKHQRELEVVARTDGGSIFSFALSSVT